MGYDQWRTKYLILRRGRGRQTLTTEGECERRKKDRINRKNQKPKQRTISKLKPSAYSVKPYNNFLLRDIAKPLADSWQKQAVVYIAVETIIGS